MRGRSIAGAVRRLSDVRRRHRFLGYYYAVLRNATDRRGMRIRFYLVENAKVKILNSRGQAVHAPGNPQYNPDLLRTPQQRILPKSDYLRALEAKQRGALPASVTPLHASKR